MAADPTRDLSEPPHRRPERPVHPLGTFRLRRPGAPRGRAVERAGPPAHGLDLAPDVWFSVRLDQGLTPTLLLRRSTTAVVAVNSPLAELQLPTTAYENGTLPWIGVQLRDHDEPVTALFTPDARFDHLFAALVGHPRTVRGPSRRPPSRSPRCTRAAPRAPTSCGPGTTAATNR